MKLLLLVNDPAFFLSHRLPVAQAARRAGYDVVVATGPGHGGETIRGHGIQHREVPMSGAGRNPLGELRALLAVRRLLKEEAPDIVHLVTIKPILYGGLVARWLGIPAMVAAVSGMGYLFTAERAGAVRRLAEMLYRAALDHPNGRVIVQNEDDRDGLRAMGALRRDQAVLVPGSGVDLDAFAPTPLPAGRPVVLLPARMLWDKGVGEFVEAARALRQRGLDARFVLAGTAGHHNPASVPLARLEAWREEGVVEWWGWQPDMAAVLAQASIVTLPSYREGMPKVLLEAAAAGRPVVTTDVPGCRDAVDPGRSGELVPARDAAALAAAIERLLGSPGERAAMGARGRERAEARHGIDRVVEAHLAIYGTLQAGPRAR